LINQIIFLTVFEGLRLCKT